MKKIIFVIFIVGAVFVCSCAKSYVPEQTVKPVSVVTAKPDYDNSSPQTIKPVVREYIGNKQSKKFHNPNCCTLPAEKNRMYFKTRDEAIDYGYSPCHNCSP